MIPRPRLFSTMTTALSAASKSRKSIPLYLRPRASQPGPAAGPGSDTSASGSSATPASPSSSVKDIGKQRQEGMAALKVNDWAEPPLVAQARAKSVKQRNVWESYLVLPAKTRLYISLGLFVFALVGLYAGDYLVPETEEEKQLKGEKIDDSIPAVKAV